jgi:hypothetical protein
MELESTSSKRPFGVACLSVMSLLSGILFIVAFVSGFMRLLSNPTLGILAGVVSGVIALAQAYGLWKGVGWSRSLLIVMTALSWITIDVLFILAWLGIYVVVDPFQMNPGLSFWILISLGGFPPTGVLGSLLVALSSIGQAYLGAVAFFGGGTFLGFLVVYYASRQSVRAFFIER